MKRLHNVCTDILPHNGLLHGKSNSSTAVIGAVKRENCSEILLVEGEARWKVFLYRRLCVQLQLEIGLHKLQPSSGPDQADNVLFLNHSSKVAFRIGVYGPIFGFAEGLGL